MTEYVYIDNMHSMHVIYAPQYCINVYKIIEKTCNYLYTDCI